MVELEQEKREKQKMIKDTFKSILIEDKELEMLNDFRDQIQGKIH